MKRNPKIPMLPVNVVQISNAVGKRICKISKQIYCTCQIRQAKITASFIQIENLNEGGIIGADILDQYRAQRNVDSQTIQWEINNSKYITSFLKKNKELYQKTKRYKI